MDKNKERKVIVGSKFWGITLGEKILSLRWGRESMIFGT
jgi:hypothetical protein